MWPYAAPMPNTANAITVALQSHRATQKQSTPKTLRRGCAGLPQIETGFQWVIQYFVQTSSSTNACLMKAHSEPILTIRQGTKGETTQRFRHPNNAMLRTAATIAVANST